MKYGIVIALCLVGLFVRAETSRIEGKYGLSFYAYEENKDERSALVVSGDRGALSFADYLSVGFDLKIRGETEHFGYVCRIVLGGKTSVDWLLNNPFDEFPGLCLIGDVFRYSFHILVGKCTTICAGKGSVGWILV